jgi:hypothetical protein
MTKCLLRRNFRNRNFQWGYKVISLEKNYTVEVYSISFNFSLFNVVFYLVIYMPSRWLFSKT